MRDRLGRGRRPGRASQGAACRRSPDRSALRSRREAEGDRDCRARVCASARNGLNVILVDRVRLAGVPFLLLVGLTLAAPAISSLSQAATEPIPQPALLT